jgi:hypothetical protein
MRSIAIYSAPRIMNNPATLKKANIKKITALTMLRVLTTTRAEDTKTKEKQ